MRSKTLTTTIAACIIFLVFAFAVSASETTDRVLKGTGLNPGAFVPPVTGSSQSQNSDFVAGQSAYSIQEEQLRKEEQAIHGEDTWKQYLQQKNQEIEAKRKELAAQKKTLEQQVKNLQTERAGAKKELLETCKPQKLSWIAGSEPTADEKAAYQQSVKDQAKLCIEKIKTFDLETRGKILELKKANIQAQKAVLGIMTDVPYNQSSSFPW